jgi:hypothetical protein
VLSLGPLINVGAAVFPAVGQSCGSGYQVMPVVPGDPTPNVSGPTHKAFVQKTARIPDGGTPTSATLVTIKSNLAGLKGRTIVLLLTDGAPNCNADASCSPSECIPVIDNACKSSTCCDPKQGGNAKECLDRVATVDAIKAIRALGVDVYVIGISDLKAYQAALDEMAVAGGVPNTSGPTKYVAVENLDKLGEVFAKIAADAVSCDIKLDKPPKEQDMTNVYFGCETVKLDAMNGWTWTGTDTVTLHGAACTQLKSGKVLKVKVISGCPTQKPT